MTEQVRLSIIPSVDLVLGLSALEGVLQNLGREPVKIAVRNEIQKLRIELSGQTGGSTDETREQLADRIAEAVLHTLKSASAPLLRPVFNLTGTVIHTNLGRSRLPDEAVAAMATAAGEAVDLEFNLESGSRGDRDSQLEKLLCELTGAEAATVVNNNAAAVVLSLNTLAQDREVLISRGELVEIGGAFRIPEVMVSAGCRLKEVGTTNRTHARDYESGLSERAALIMKVHTSNYRIQGFTAAVSESELASIAEAAGIPLISDLGSGSLVDLSRFGLPAEPTVRATIESGADVVTFSGDKLLGGPQSGIIVGRADLIARIKSNPLKRAMRVDKTILAALLAVLQLHRDPEILKTRLPLLVDLCRSEDDIRLAVERVLPVVREALGSAFEASCIACKSQIGSGALPMEMIPSYALAIRPAMGGGEAQLSELTARLRSLEKPVIGRLSDGVLLLDLRCLRDEQGFCEQLSQV